MAGREGYRPGGRGEGWGAGLCTRIRTAGGSEGAALGGRGGAGGGAPVRASRGLGPQELSASAAHPASPPERPPALQPPG